MWQVKKVGELQCLWGGGSRGPPPENFKKFLFKWDNFIALEKMFGSYTSIRAHTQPYVICVHFLENPFYIWKCFPCPMGTPLPTPASYVSFRGIMQHTLSYRFKCSEIWGLLENNYSPIIFDAMALFLNHMLHYSIFHYIGGWRVQYY